MAQKYEIQTNKFDILYKYVQHTSNAVKKHNLTNSTVIRAINSF